MGEGQLDGFAGDGGPLRDATVLLDQPLHLAEQLRLPSFSAEVGDLDPEDSQPHAQGLRQGDAHRELVALHHQQGAHLMVVVQDALEARRDQQAIVVGPPEVGVDCRDEPSVVDVFGLEPAPRRTPGIECHSLPSPGRVGCRCATRTCVWIVLLWHDFSSKPQKEILCKRVREVGVCIVYIPF